MRAEVARGHQASTGVLGARDRGRREQVPGGAVQGEGRRRERGHSSVSYWGDHGEAAADEGPEASPSKGQVPTSCPPAGRAGVWDLSATQPDSGARLQLAVSRRP